MRIRIVIEAEVERREGKFASREDLGDQLVEELEGADPGELEGENEGQYEVVEWIVTREEAK